MPQPPKARPPGPRTDPATRKATVVKNIEKTTTHRRVMARVVTWISAMSVAVAIAFGVASAQPASAAPPRAAVTVTSVAQPMTLYVAAAKPAASNAWGVTASKTWAFTQCIFAVGVPIGLVVAIATNPATWAYVLGYTPQPNLGGSINRYLSFVKSRCGYSLR